MLILDIFKRYAIFIGLKIRRYNRGGCFMCDVLKEIYNKTNGNTFNFANKEDRIALQKTVYLLMNMGINVGDYSFEWSQNGPYSVTLDADAFKYSTRELKENVQFSDIAISKMEQLVKYIKEGNEKFGDYTRTKWLECIASLHYLKFILCVGKLEEDVLSILQERKAYLNNSNANIRALEIANEIENI